MLLALLFAADAAQLRRSVVGQRAVGLDAQKDLIIAPLEKVAVLNKDVAAALKVWSAASEDQQKAWTKAYSDALDKAEEGDGGVKVAAGTYGPVPVMMMGMLDLGRAGLLEGALTSN